MTGDEMVAEVIAAQADVIAHTIVIDEMRDRLRAAIARLQAAQDQLDAYSARTA